MTPAKQIIRVFFPALFSITLLAGCVTTRSCQYTEAPSGQILSPNPNFQDSSKWAGSTDEMGRIRYLLERVASSDNHFIRNGETFDGKVARQWLLYKMGHWVNGGLKTADDFVTRVATFSQRTGQPYLVQFSDGQVYSLSSVLRNELFLFNNHQNKISPSAVAQPASS